MEYILTASQMKECDRITIEEYGMPAMVLMERAALACAEVILERDARLMEQTGGVQPGRRLLVIAGCGNNGGDGLAIGRLLAQKGFPVDFVLVGEEAKCTPETAQQLRILRAYGWDVTVCTTETPFRSGHYDYIIDALFGIGLKSEVRPLQAAAIEYMNRQDAYVLSVDIPSGIHTDTGAVCGCAVQADVTVTFAFRKRGLVLYPGARYAGTVLCREIGITEDSLQKYSSVAEKMNFSEKTPEVPVFTYSGHPAGLLPPRDADGNKGTFGKVSLFAGSAGMAGAAVLAASAVLHAGAGMVRVISDESNRVVLQTTLPEAMFGGFPEGAAARSWANVIAAGPGMGTGEDALQMLRRIVENSIKPLILDADAINLLADHPELLSCLEERQQDPEAYRELVLTPHPGELARLDGSSVPVILADPFAAAAKWAKRLSAAVLCKGARTVVADKTGRIYLNTSGNSGMATAGSGDVLTGIIAALAAQGMNAFDAAIAGVCLHGCAGDAAAHRKNEYSMTAQDLIAELDSLM